MTGLEMKQFLRDERIDFGDLCSRLGNISFQRLNSLFQATDVKSGTLEKIASLYGKNIGWFYGLDKSETPSNPSENTQPSPVDGSALQTLSERFLDLLEEKDRQISSLIRLIEENK